MGNIASDLTSDKNTSSHVRVTRLRWSSVHGCMSQFQCPCRPSEENRMTGHKNVQYKNIYCICLLIIGSLNTLQHRKSTSRYIHTQKTMSRVTVDMFWVFQHHLLHSIFLQADGKLASMSWFLIQCHLEAFPAVSVLLKMALLLLSPSMPSALRCLAGHLDSGLQNIFTRPVISTCHQFQEYNET